MSDKIKKESPNLSEEYKNWLKEQFPSCFTEDKLDFVKLKQLVSGIVDDREEKYTFSWAGRSDSIKNLQIPSIGTLIPAKDESIDFDNTENIFIEGDNLESLKLLQKSYTGKIKMIYIDPPYNTGNDFIYKDDFSNSIDAYMEQTKQSKKGMSLTTNPETSGRFHSDWISFMYPRLFLARDLLTEDGIIFVSIDNHEIHNLVLVMNEIFGEENLIDLMVWKKRYGGGAKSKFLVSLHEYVLFFAKNRELIEEIYVPLTKESIERYYKIKDKNFEKRGPYRTHPLEAQKSVGQRKNLIFPIIGPDGTEIMPKLQWRWEKNHVDAALKKKEIEFLKDKNDQWSVHTKQYLLDEGGEQRKSKSFSIIEDVYTQHGTKEIEELFGNSLIFPFAKPSGLVKHFLHIADLHDNDIVLDFFAGSCTTAHAVLEQNKSDGTNRNFICVQLPESLLIDSEAYKKGYTSIADIGKERIRRVIQNIKKESKQTKLNNDEQKQDLGFKVFKLAKSNYKVWEDVKDQEKLKEQLKLFEEPLIENYKDIDVIYEVILKEGYSLNSKIETVSTKLNKIYKVTDGDFYFCVTLDKEISKETIGDLNLDQNTMFVCLDSALNDSQKSNISKVCKLKTI